MSNVPGRRYDSGAGVQKVLGRVITPKRQRHVQRDMMSDRCKELW